MNYNYNNMCNSCKTEPYMQNCQCLDELPLGIAYVPWQKWKNVQKKEWNTEPYSLI